MITGLYVIYDKVLKNSCPVFSSKNDGVAIRQTNQLLSEIPSLSHIDYVLYKVGEYDDEKLIIEPHKREINYTEVDAEKDIEKSFLQKVKDKVNGK